MESQYVPLEFMLFAFSLQALHVLGQLLPGEGEGKAGVKKEMVLALLRRVADANDRSDLFREKEGFMDEIYTLIFHEPEAMDAILWSCELRLKWWLGSFTAYSYSTSVDSERARIREAFSALAKRAEGIDGVATLDETVVPLPDRTAVLDKLRVSENNRFRNEAAEKQMRWMRFSYLTGRRELAAKHADLVARLDVDLEAVDYNNVGYLRLSQRRFEEARTMFDRGLASAQAHSEDSIWRGSAPRSWSR